MNLTPHNELIWVDQRPQFRRMIADLMRHPLLAVDTESNSLFVYREQVCLIQFSTGEKDYLLDTLALDNLSELDELFASPKYEKIFHAAEYDLLCLHRDFGFIFSNIYDTMIAGRILGKPEIGLAAMIEGEFGIHLDKRYQRANWGKRPLPPEQLEYARLDTFYLIPLRERTMAALKESGRWELAQEDFRRQCIVELSAENNASPCWKVAGNNDLSPQQIAVLDELCQMRDQKARQANIPVFKVLSNNALLQIAQDLPRTLEELNSLRCLSGSEIARYGESLLQVVERGLSREPLRRPFNHHRPDERYVVRLEALRGWRKRTGAEQGVPSDVILPRSVLEQIAQLNPKSEVELQPIMADLPWRYQRYKADILKVLQS